MTLPTNRASYQRTDNIVIGNRQAFACDSHRQTFNAIAKEAIKASEATTQAAYLMRMTNLRSLFRSLKG